METEEKIIEFLNTIEKLKSTLRHNRSSDGRQESDAEHTRRVAVFLMLIQDVKKYEIDMMKTVKMILIHDIPEVVHGDIPSFKKEKDMKFHNENEKTGAKQIFGLLPNGLDKEYYNLYIEFEKGESKEARLAKALDKIETNLQHRNSGSDYWCEEEKGEPMLTYLDKPLEKLNDPFISNIRKLIKIELEKLTHT